MDIDYRDILKKYIKHVGYHEGVSYISDHNRIDGMFSDEEWQVLNELENELDMLANVYLEKLEELREKCEREEITLPEYFEEGKKLHKEIYGYDH